MFAEATVVDQGGRCPRKPGSDCAAGAPTKQRERRHDARQGHASKPHQIHGKLRTGNSIFFQLQPHSQVPVPQPLPSLRTRPARATVSVRRRWRRERVHGRRDVNPAAVQAGVMSSLTSQVSIEARVPGVSATSIASNTRAAAATPRRSRSIGEPRRSLLGVNTHLELSGRHAGRWAAGFPDPCQHRLGLSGAHICEPNDPYVHVHHSPTLQSSSKHRRTGSSSRADTTFSPRDRARDRSTCPQRKGCGCTAARASANGPFVSSRPARVPQLSGDLGAAIRRIPSVSGAF